MVKKYRGRFEIISNILYNLKNNGPSVTSKLMYDAELNHLQTKSYFTDLLKSGLIEKVENKLVITSKGIEWIKQFNELSTKTSVRQGE